MDELKRTALIGEITRQPAAAEDPLPVVGVELFFDGNDDIGSIGCNLLNHPGTAAFRELLMGIRARNDVQDVLVEVYEVASRCPASHARAGIVWAAPHRRSLGGRRCEIGPVPRQLAILRSRACGA